MPTYLPFDPNPRAPEHRVPHGACDSQFHVLGDPVTYPVRPGAMYEMPEATVHKLLHMHRTLGIERGVIVQPTTYGADHQVTLDGLKIAGPGYRACANASVFQEMDDGYIAKLDAAGVKGARFSRGSLGIDFSPADLDRAFARIEELGWYAKIQPETDGIASVIGRYEKLRVPVLMDHLGRPDPAKGKSDPNLQKVIELLRRGNFWVMLSLVEKISKGPAGGGQATSPPWDDVIPAARAIIEAARDRVVWASDWPHPVSVKQPPNEGELMDFLWRCTNDDAERRKILVDNPAVLFGFAASGG